jgi:Stigma-specific protein, Stig1/Putative metal-binding motif
VSARIVWRAWLLSTLCATLFGCTFSDRQQHCVGSSTCESGMTCYQGFCVQPDAPSKGGRDAGSSRGDAGKASRPGASAGTGTTTEPTTAGGSPANHAAGRGGAPGATAGSAASDAGPPPEMVKDASPPPPDKSACSDGAEQACLIDASSSTTRSEGCNRGTQHCTGSTWGACVLQAMPTPEQCNGLDDDCDNLIDEQTSTDCYPDGQIGCTMSGSSWACAGTCALGKKTCVAGKPSDCNGAKTPAPETCNASPGADENCNGVTDENCACTGTETRSCYSGSVLTLNVGKCVAGTQTCSNGVLAACVGGVTPTAENCANESADDDCNGVADDIPNRGAACSVTNNGSACAGKLQCAKGATDLSCVATQTPEVCNGMDDDCNGKVDDTFNLQTDAANCGTCGNACAVGSACCAGKCVNETSDVNNCGACAKACTSGSSCAKSVCVPPAGTCTPACSADQTCCSGKCVDLKSDIANCGKCGGACTTGNQPGCCASACVDLLTVANCGTCGHACTLVPDAGTGITCTCTMSSSGIACSGPVLNVCL